ncbi:phosphoribosylformylglycinamidine synthase [Candidatus Peregrinibacteria bacterium CG10_big_fil_rev_8_21_14_0_10_36_19]|nr:MAG: phosphoribosylformylglycinamidine synthase [Candidatus Peregrinibacteria bacterium CG10_big_fil_rev_8_21_14_0_10_36_19]
MAHRIEIFTEVNDTKSQTLKKRLESLGYNVEKVRVVEVYTIGKELTPEQINKVAHMLANPISQSYKIDTAANEDFDHAIEIGFLPGVTDNVGSTAKESTEDLLKIKFQGQEAVHTSKLIFIKGDVDATEISKNLANDLIQRIHIKTKTDFERDGGMDTIIPIVQLESEQKVDEVNLNISEEDLLKLGKEGIPNADGTRRGPLALEKDYLHAIKSYYEKEGRNPTDIELESLAQTWSEHCKHTIFAAQIDENPEGLYKGFIKKATQEVRKAKGKDDFCVSVFSDNSGGIVFDENWVITDKAETHNSPSALDPFGGAITGIVGVNRDCVGFGKGAKPIINKYGFCVGNPQNETPLFRDKEKNTPALTPKRILEGVVDGVNAGGNESGIPTPQGFVYFDDSYKGKPLVFVGTVGLIPREINGKPSWEKQAKAGDKIVVVGGRVGQDGIHGATFSSEALTTGSPATAVQIGDPITQKKLSDAIVKEARDLELYNSITDCGAGGISCSVAEMAKECGGCDVELDKVPTKYPNLEPWQIWISESQERMTLAVPPEKLTAFIELMNKRGVEASVIGEFTDSGRCVVNFNNEKIMDLEMDFLHDGLPKKELKTQYNKPELQEPTFEEPQNLTETLHKMLERPNITSFEFISRQYDHIVQGTAVLGPLHGKGRVNSNASVTKPFIETNRGIICSQGINATYSQIDTYDMAASAIDTAIRNAIAIGGNLDHLALMDNFCWCSSNDPQRLGELKSAAQACYNYAVAYGTPYISGKDSMFNDFQGFDNDSNPIKISALPTLLVSSISVTKDITKTISMDTKFANDLVYILGETKDELGGSEYFGMHNEIGKRVPKVNAQKAISLYRAFMEAADKRLIASSISITHGGLAVALAKKAIAGQMGMNIDLSNAPQENMRKDHLLFSETQSRFIVTVAPTNKSQFEEIFKDQQFALIGTTTEDQKFIIKDTLETDIPTLEKRYKSTFKNY